MYYPFHTLIKCRFQFSRFRFKLVNQGDKPVILVNFDFNEENHEQNHGSCLDVHVIDLMTVFKLKTNCLELRDEVVDGS